MGSVFSKSASKIPPPRKYPLRPPPPPHRPAPTPTSRPSANPTQPDLTDPSSEPLHYTAPTPEPFDPQYAASLRRLGSVQPIDPFAPPSPHQHPSSSSSATTTTSKLPPTSHSQQSTFPPSYSSSLLAANPAVQVLNRRRAIQRAAEKEFAGAVEAGAEYQRSFLDVVTLRRVLVLRDRGVPGTEIERELGLREGLVGRLGRKDGVVSPAGVVGLVE